MPVSINEKKPHRCRAHLDLLERRYRDAKVPCPHLVHPLKRCTVKEQPVWQAVDKLGEDRPRNENVGHEESMDRREHEPGIAPPKVNLGRVAIIVHQ